MHPDVDGTAPLRDTPARTVVEETKSNQVSSTSSKSKPARAIEAFDISKSNGDEDVIHSEQDYRNPIRASAASSSPSKVTRAAMMKEQMGVGTDDANDKLGMANQVLEHDRKVNIIIHVNHSQYILPCDIFSLQLMLIFNIFIYR